MTRARQLAREAIAAEFDRKGREWRSLADNIRAGFENLWLTPSLDAMERLVLLAEDGDEDETEAGRT